jgi:hypothetical protein
MDAKVLLKELKDALNELERVGTTNRISDRSPEALAAELGKILWDLTKPWAAKEQEKGR